MGSLSRIKRAGFDAAEAHLIGDLRSPECVALVRAEARDLGLMIRFHQGWSWETGQRSIHNRMLRWAGALVPEGKSLEKQLANAGTDEVVVYGSRIDEPSRSNYLYQTASEHVGGEEYVMPYTHFAQVAQQKRVPLVLDTQHVLEWKSNAQNVAGLLTESRRDLLEAIRSTWTWCGSLVQEIHLNDFLPSLGAQPGRNLFPGDGVFPTREFCEMVRDSGWQGVVTPETAPKHTKGGRLRELRETVVRLFEG